MPAARPSEAVIRNAIKAAQSCGVTVSVVEVMPGGGVRILASGEYAPVVSDESAEDAWDRATGTVL